MSATTADLAAVGYVSEFASVRRACEWCAFGRDVEGQPLASYCTRLAALVAPGGYCLHFARCAPGQRFTVRVLVET